MISLINSLLSYLLLMVIIVIVGGIAITLGITLRKRKNMQEESTKAVSDGEQGE